MIAPFPFASLPRLSRAGAALASLLARWTLARPIGARVAALVGARARLRLVRVTTGPHEATSDPFAALAELRLHGQSLLVGAASAFVRELAQKRLFGPDELAAPRPLSQVEHAVFAALVAAAVVDAGVAAEVWPVVDAQRARAGVEGAAVAPIVVELALDVEGRAAPVTLTVWCPASLRVAVPPPRAVPRWELELPVRVGVCALHRAAVARLAVRDVIVVERQLGLAVGDGLIGLSAAPGAVEARVASDYVRRDMALPDDAHLELTVELGTTRLSLRQLAELVPGSVVPLGRPLAGPFEVRAAGQRVGQGELVDVDGELGVRIVSIANVSSNESLQE